MPSPHATVALLGSLVFVLRHEHGALEHQDFLLKMIRAALAGRSLKLVAMSDALKVGEESIPLDAPGAALLCDQLLLHEIRIVGIPADIADADLVRLAAVLAAFPGTHPTYADVLAALGPTAGRLDLSRLSADFEVFGADSPRPDATIDPFGEATFGLQKFHPMELDPTAAGATELVDSPMGGVVPASRPGMSQLLIQCREAVDRQDWEGLLEAAVQIVEMENDTSAGLAGSLHRVEFKRLMSRRNLSMIARLAHGDRKQEAITMLRRFGTEGTEVLMDLLVEATNIGERRGFYSALVQMNEGTSVIVEHLNHPQWYVVRNAADLCGELALSEAIPSLARQTRHPDERVRKAVAEALGKIATPVAMETLARLLTDPAQAVRMQAVAHLRGKRVRGMTGPIGELLKREEDPSVQQEALLALGRIGSPEAIALLQEWASGGGLLHRHPMAARLIAIRAMGLAGPAAVDALAALQRDSSAEIRDAAAAAPRAAPR